MAKKSMLRMDISGIEQTINAFDHLRKELQQELDRATKEAGAVVKVTAQSNAPVLTGQLRNAIVVDKYDYKNPNYVGYDVMIDPNKADKFRKPIKKPKGERKDSFYPTVQEYGTEKIPAANGGRGFMRPALYDNKSTVKGIIQSRIKMAIEAVKPR